MFRFFAILLLGLTVAHFAYASDSGSIPYPSGQPATAPTTQPEQDSAKGHGSITIDYFNTDINGFWLRSNNKLPLGNVHMLGTGLDASYNISNNWTIFGGIRYFTGRYSGSYPNCPTTAPPQCAGAPPLTPQHPESPFLDDGNYHGTWQNWDIGAAWNTNIGNYYITTSATAYIPTHDYPTFGNAVVGQDLDQLLLDVRLSHQFDFTNFYYQLEYGYAFSQHVLGVNTGYQRFDAELGWFVNDKLTLRGFVTGRAGFGARADLGPPTFGSGFYERQRAAQHDYRAAGFGFDYNFDNRYTASASIQHEFWGDTVYDFKYALEVHLTRSF